MDMDCGGTTVLTRSGADPTETGLAITSGQTVDRLSMLMPSTAKGNAADETGHHWNTATATTLLPLCTSTEQLLSKMLVCSRLCEERTPPRACARVDGDFEQKMSQMVR
jgi:hypothetical protein